MATKKQKREAAERKHAEFMEQTRQSGLAAQQADRENRAQKIKDQKAQKAKELLAEHERQKQAQKDIADARREHQSFMDLDPKARAAFMAAASTLTDEQLEMMRELQYTACAFALGRGEYCKGDVRFPATHSTKCPHYSATDLALSSRKI